MPLLLKPPVIWRIAAIPGISFDCLIRLLSDYWRCSAGLHHVWILPGEGIF